MSNTYTFEENGKEYAAVYSHDAAEFLQIEKVYCLDEGDEVMVRKLPKPLHVLYKECVEHSRVAV